MKVIIYLLVVFAFHLAVKGLTVLSKYNFQTLLDFLILLAHEKKIDCLATIWLRIVAGYRAHIPLERNFP